MRILRRIAACVAVFAAAVSAQSDRGTITGTISDPANAVVPNAKVVAKNTATGTLAETVTTATGNYTLASLPVGTYELSIEAPGFKKITQSGLQVQVAQTVRLDVTLQVGAATESVTVTAEAGMIKTENAEQSINVSGDRINNLPINFGGGGGSSGNIRSWTAFALLSPGVVGNAQDNRINGAQSGGYKIIVEGQEVTSQNQVTWTSTVSQASVEHIEEFSLQTSNYAPEFGQVAGGLFNFTIKSGTNSLHGSAYDYFTNEALDAQRPFVFVRPISRKQDFGGSLTGPVWIPKLYDGRNRTFFSFNYEAFRNHLRASATLQTVPTEAYRNGDFSEALTLRSGFSRGNDREGRPVIDGVIYDLGTNQTINGLVYRQPFPGNIIPRNRMDPVSLAIQEMIPKPNVPGAGLINNWIPDNAYDRTQDLPGIKIDHSFNPTNKVSFYYSKQTTDQLTSPDGLPFPISAVRVQAIYGITTRLNYDYSITPTMLLHLGTGYLRFHNPDSSPSESLQYDAVAGIGFRGSVTDPSGFPRINGLNGNNYGGMQPAIGPSNANAYYDSKWSAVASLNYIRGSHSYKIGGEYQINSWTDRNTRGAQGILAYNADETGPSTSVNGIALAPGQSGLGYASFLLGAVNNASVNAVQDPQWRGYKAALYVQDDWKVNRKLTVNYGVRWDILSQGHEIWYRNSMFGPSIPNANAGGLPGGIVYEGFGPGRCNCNFVNPYPYSIGPRLSAAYQIDSKTVLRAGIGVIYGNVGQLSYLTNAQIQGVGINQQQFPNPENGQPALFARNGLVFNRADLYKATLDPGLLVTPGGALNGGPADTIDPNAGRPPRVLQWNISLQREIRRDIAFEAAYVANRGVWLTQNGLVRPNGLTRERLASFGLDPFNNAADRALLTGPLTSSAAVSRGFNKVPYPGFLTSNTVAQSLRPFPQFSGNLAPRWAPLGNSWYDSLQMKLTKRFGYGLDGSVAFTWSKELSTSAISDLTNRALNKSLTSNGRPYVLVIGFNYEAPRVTQNKYVRNIVGGWTLGGLMVYQSGELIQVPNSNTVINSYTFMGAPLGGNVNGTRKNRVPGEPLYLKDLNCGCIDPYKDLVFNPKAWVEVPEGTYSPASPYFNDYRQARRPSEQFSLGRRFSLARWKEGMYFQIRAEFFNAFNRLQHAIPSSNNSDAGTTRAQNGNLTGGFGFINPFATGNTAPALPRNGQLVARFQF